MVDVTDREALEAWLRKQPRGSIAAIASRCALRALPMFDDQSERSAESRSQLVTLCRAILSSAVAAVGQSPNERLAHNAAEAADAAIAAITSAINSPGVPRASTYAAANAANAVDTKTGIITSAKAAADAVVAADFAIAKATKCTDVARVATTSDLESLETHSRAESLFANPLWPARSPDGIVKRWLSLRARFIDDNALTFWLGWYEAMRDGEPVDWKLLENVALIDTAFWAEGPDRVAEEIARIEAKYAAVPPPSAFRAQARRALEEPQAVEAEAEGLDALIEEALERYRRETGMNRLPDPLLPLEDLPSRLRALSTAVEEETADRINDLEADALNAERKIERLEAALAGMAETIALLTRQIREAEARYADEIATLSQRTATAAKESILAEGARTYVMATSKVMGAATGLVLVGGMWNLLGRPMETDLSELAAFAKSLRVGSR